MNNNVNKVGRPRKTTKQKCQKHNTAYTSENESYILGLLEERRLQVKGHFSKIVNELISDHRNVKAYKERQAQKLKGELAVLGE